MNGIENITARIKEGARLETEEILKKADAECETIKSKYREIAQEEYWTIITKGKQDSDRRAERILNTAQTETKKQMLALKQEMVSKAFEMAAEKITKLPENKYTDYLIKLAVKASRTGTEQLIFSKNDRNRIGKRVADAASAKLLENGINAKLTLSEETRPLRGGLILKDVNIEINCSIETVLDMRRNELAGEVAKLLFEE